MFRIYASTLGPLLLSLATLAVYYYFKVHRHGVEAEG